MKEQLHTIPVNEAFDSADECPFCYLQRQAEQRTIRYVAGPGASYMEPDVRLATDKAGFCREHMKKLYDYGNALGSALILQTHYARLLEQFRKDAAAFAPPGKRIFWVSGKAAKPPNCPNKSGSSPARATSATRSSTIWTATITPSVC